MHGAMFVAQARHQAGKALRVTEAAAASRPSAEGLLTLNPPQSGNVVSFDTRDYAIIDFRLITNQWTALLQVGLTLKIFFADGSVIELLNFFSSVLADDAPSGDEQTGTTTGEGPASTKSVLVRTTDTEFLSPDEFGRSYWVTKTSGLVVLPSRDDFHVFGIEPVQFSSDLDPLFFPLAPLPPFFPVVIIDGTTPPVFITGGGGDGGNGGSGGGANEPAVITGDSDGAVVEAGGANNAIPGIPTDSGDLDAVDVDNPNDTWNAVTAPAPSANGYGSFTLTAAGVWTYTLNNANAAVQALSAGSALADSFTVTTVDGTSQVVSITITGANDTPVVTGAVDSGAVTEDVLPEAANGTIDFGDVDLADAHVTSVTPGGGSYLGTFTANVTNDSTGDGVGQVTWLFTADNALLQSRGDGQVLVQTYTVVIDDGHGGTASQLVTITITGTDDAAVITGDSTGAVVEAGGVNNGIPGTPTDSGDLDATDVDGPPDSWEVVVSPAASTNGYGTFTITADGVWTYTLDNSNAVVQALPASGSLADAFTVVTIDGTSQVVSITITGANDAPVAVADGNGGDAVIESGVVAGDPSAAGNVLTNDTDVDTGDSRTVTAVNGAAVNVGQALVGLYGTLTLLADGSWTYALDDTDPDTNALAEGQIATDVFSYTVSDANGATSSAALTITITGGNDAPVVTGAVDSGAVTEGSLPVMVADGKIDFGDVDLADAHVTSVTPGGAGYLGTFVASVTDASTGDGIGQVTWLFAANNALRQSLGDGDVLVQTYTVVIDDGHGGTASQLVTITITGTNDAAVITGDSDGAVVEAGGVDNAIAGTPTDSGDLDATDVDGPPDSWEVVGSPATSTNGYGTFTITADGVWTYTLNNSNPAVQAVPLGGSLADTFTVATIDGTSQVVSITITGANDAPVAVADGNGGDAVTESGVVAGDPSATGNVLTNDTDVDTGDSKTVTAVNGSAVNVGQPLVGLYGTLTLLADGTWTCRRPVGHR
jgi:VCBS repeat-containing protein